MMTPAQFKIYCVGSHNRVEDERKTVYENSRMISFFTVAPHTKKMKQPADLYPLRWDVKETSKVLNQEGLKSLKDSFNFKPGKTSEVKG